VTLTGESAIDAAQAFLGTVNTREAAATFWLVAFAAFVVFHRSTRPSAVGVLKALAKPVLLAPLAIAALYAGAEIWALQRFGLWSATNLKTTILWLATFAFVTMFEVANAKERPASLGKITRDVVSVTAVLVFITGLHTFPLIVELIAFPLVTLIALTGEFAKHKPEHAPAARLLSCMTTAIGFLYLGFSLLKTVEQWQKAATWNTASEFVIPILLSLGFLPFLYGWRTYVAYNSMFTTIGIFGIESRLVPYARWLAITRIRGDVVLLDRWRKALQTSRPSNKAELKHSLEALRALTAREKSPPAVQPKDGWSPYFAMQFMADLGVETGHYHHSFDGEWFASSPMREFGNGAIWRNNIAYYIDGSEQAANTLKIKLNVNDPSAAREAEDMFVLHSLHLLEQAVSLDAVERLKGLLASLDDFEANIPFGKVTLKREAFDGGIPGGYSRIFRVRRGADAAD
jgi:hypothetical protein